MFSKSELRDGEEDEQGFIHHVILSGAQGALQGLKKGPHRCDEEVSRGRGHVGPRVATRGKLEQELQVGCPVDFPPEG